MSTTNKVYIITDRGITYSDSVSRYIVDTYKGLADQGWEPTIYTTNESRLQCVDPEFQHLRVMCDELPDVDADAIFHVHLTFSIRKHTQFVLENIAKLKHKLVVTFHVDPLYAEAMGLSENIPLILKPLSDNGVLTYVFSNYSKHNFENHGYKNVFVVYPGLDLSIYKEFQNATPKNQVLFVSSNPDNTFINEVKGAYLLEQIQHHFQDYEIVQRSNIPFRQLLQDMAESKFYLALGKYEHYGFSIIDAFNLGTIPIYNNAGGLVEAVHGRGFPFYVRDREVMGIQNFAYDFSKVASNYWYSNAVHDHKAHISNLISLYNLLS